MQAHDAEHLACRLVERDEGDGARVVDLDQLREEGMAELADRREEAQAQILVSDMLQEFEKEALVLRPDGPHEDAPPVLRARWRSHSLG